MRIESDTPSFAAITLVAPGVLFSSFAIFLTPAFAFAIVFICFTSALVHSRRTIFFLALAIVTPVLRKRPCTKKLSHDNVTKNLTTMK